MTSWLFTLTREVLNNPSINMYSLEMLFIVVILVAIAANTQSLQYPIKRQTSRSVLFSFSKIAVFFLRFHLTL